MAAFYQMRVLYVGGHDLGKVTLQYLVQKGIEIVAAVETDTDDPWYFGLEEVTSVTGIPLIKAKNINDPGLIETFREMAIDIIAVVNFSQIIRKPLIELPTTCIFNVHASLLPRYRGRAPLNWAMIHGETHTGVTIHQINQGTDTGDILMQKIIPIEETDYIGDIMDRVTSLYPQMVFEVIERLSQNCIKFTPQSSEHASYFGKRSKEDGRIDWNGCAKDIRNLIRAVSRPYPGAFAEIDGKQYTIWRAEYLDQEEQRLIGMIPPAKPGEVLEIESDYIYVQCADAVLKLTEFEQVAL